MNGLEALAGDGAKEAWAEYTRSLFGSEHPQKAHQKRAHAFGAGYEAGRAAAEAEGARLRVLLERFIREAGELRAASDDLAWDYHTTEIHELALEAEKALASGSARGVEKK